MGLENSVIFKGEVNNENLAIEYNMSHAFVLPSKGETFGVVYIEALACGIPVIATSEGGPREFVNGKNGLLLSNANAESLYRLMDSIYVNYKDYKPNEISKTIIEKFGRDSFCSLLNAYIDRTMK